LHGGERARAVPFANDDTHAAAPLRAAGDRRHALAVDLDPCIDMKKPA
jgi:hypothetical protein